MKVRHHNSGATHDKSCAKPRIRDHLNHAGRGVFHHVRHRGQYRRHYRRDRGAPRDSCGGRGKGRTGGRGRTGLYRRRNWPRSRLGRIIASKHVGDQQYHRNRTGQPDGAHDRRPSRVGCCMPGKIAQRVPHQRAQIEPGASRTLAWGRRRSRRSLRRPATRARRGGPLRWTASRR